MRDLLAFPRTLAAFGLLALIQATPRARASDYYHGGGNFNDMAWTLDTPGSADYSVNQGPPGPGDNAYLSGGDTVTLTGIRRSGRHAQQCPELQSHQHLRRGHVQRDHLQQHR